MAWLSTSSPKSKLVLVHTHTCTHASNKEFKYVQLSQSEVSPIHTVSAFNMVCHTITDPALIYPLWQLNFILDNLLQSKLLP